MKKIYAPHELATDMMDCFFHLYQYVACGLGLDVEDEAERRAQPLVKVAGAAAEQQLPGHGAEEGREHVGDAEQRAHQSLGGDVAAAQQPGVEHAHDRAEHGDEERDLDRVPHRAEVLGIEQLRLEQLGVELPLIEERVVHDHEDGDDDDDQQQHEAEDGQRAVETDAAAFESRKVLLFAEADAHAVCASFLAG